MDVSKIKLKENYQSVTYFNKTEEDEEDDSGGNLPFFKVSQFVGDRHIFQLNNIDIPTDIEFFDETLQQQWRNRPLLLSI